MKRLRWWEWCIVVASAPIWVFGALLLGVTLVVGFGANYLWDLLDRLADNGKEFDDDCEIG